jgi:hypothetical protein
MDAVVANVSGTNPLTKSIRVNQHYNVRNNATVQQFRSDLEKQVDAVAFLGHSNYATIDVGNGPQNYSIGINFYYPLSPGKNPGDVSSWDIDYPCTPIGMCIPEQLTSECTPPTSITVCNGPNGPPPVNKLLPLEKDTATVTGLTDPVWRYTNEVVTTSDTPGPPHRPSLLANTLAVNAKVMFVGACYLIPGGQILSHGQVPVFLQMWDIHDANFDFAETRDRAMILPAAGSESFLEDAAFQWENILNDMVNNKKTVQQAVDDVNKNDKIQQFVVYGNHGVKITTAPVSP